jgi:hypothetical protein
LPKRSSISRRIKARHDRVSVKSTPEGKSLHGVFPREWSRHRHTLNTAKSSSHQRFTIRGNHTRIGLVKALADCLRRSNFLHTAMERLR